MYFILHSACSLANLQSPIKATDRAVKRLLYGVYRHRNWSMHVLLYYIFVSAVANNEMLDVLTKLTHSLTLCMSQHDKN